MKVIHGYKTELDPNNVQRTLLAKSCGAARWAYNWGLQRKEDVYDMNRLPVPRIKCPTAIDLHRELNRLKKDEVPWMYEVSKCAPQEALRALDIAYKNMFEDLKNERLCRKRGKEHKKHCGRQHVRYPQFKSKKNGLGGFTVTGSIAISKRHIMIPRVGRLRLKERGYLPPGRHGEATVSERAGRWYVSVHAEEEREVPENTGPPAGVDPGLLRFATISDGTFIGNPKFMKHHRRKVGHLQKEVSRKKKGSNNRRKAVRRLARKHKRVADLRMDFIHKVTTGLTKTKSVIGTETPNVRGLMKNHCVAGAFADTGWGEMIRQLGYKAVWYGSRLVQAGRFFPSTQLCSRCLASGVISINRISLDERVYRCEVCGLVIDRDLNASINLELVAASSAETVNACGEAASTQSTGQVSSMNQELSIVRGVSTNV